MNPGSRDVIQQVKEAADIVEIVGRYVPTLKRAGASYKGHCPFHKEKTPSFHVVPAKGIFHCFGCGAGGSVIDFVMRAERLDFAEALRKLAEELGIEMPDMRGRSPAERDEEQRRLRTIAEVNAEALKWFRRNLVRGVNQLAREYLPKRGITPEISERFQIGAALDSWDALKEHLRRTGYSEDALVEAGLCGRSESGRVYDRFRNRLIFPIWDVNNRVCGFGGRALVDEPNSPKYLNTGETLLFRKNALLYALNLGFKSIEETGYAILCEGYMDVVMAHAHGLTQAVASLGTGLTPQQARLLRRFAQRVYFLYDGDEAGQKAMLREGDALLGAGLDARVLSLPPEDDPDTYLQREGKEPLLAQMESAEEYFDFALRTHAAEVDLGTLAGEKQLADKMLPIVESIGDEVMRQSAVSRLMRKLGGLSWESDAERLLGGAAGRRRRPRQTPGGELAPQESTPGRPEEERAPGTFSREDFNQLDMTERHLLAVMLEDTSALAYIRAEMRSEWIRDSKLKPWIFYLTDGEGEAAELLHRVEESGEVPGDSRVLSAVMAWEYPSAQSVPQLGAAKQLLMKLLERHQKAVTQELLMAAEQYARTPEEAERFTTIFHNEHRVRFENASRHLRAGDSRTRAERGHRLRR